MKAFLTACVAMAVITVGAWYTLDAWGPTEIDGGGGDNVRLSDQ